MISVDIRSRTPIYEQIIQSIKELVVKGIMEPGEKLPSVRELAKDMTLNPNTVQKAYQELERQGLIVTFRGKGTFVNLEIEMGQEKERVKRLKDEMKKLMIEAKTLGMEKKEVVKIVKEVLEELEGGESDVKS